MKISIFQDFNEMKDAYQMIIESPAAWKYDVSKYLQEIRDDNHWHSLPVLTAAINRFIGSSKEGAVCLTAALGMAYLADFIHGRVKDDSEGQMYTPELQSSILMGDYIFGRSVQTLCALNRPDLVKCLCDLVCAVNEGHTARRQNGGKTNPAILAMEKASFYQYSFKMSALLNDCTPREVRLFEDTGHNTGMALELYGCDLSTSLVHLDRARSLLTAVSSQTRNGEKIPLRRIFDDLMGGSPDLAVAML